MMTSLFSLLVVLSFSLIAAAAAEEETCETQNLNLLLGPVRNQSDVGWCFGNTAADLLTVSNLTDLRSHYASTQKTTDYLDLFQPELQVSSMYSSLNYFHAQILAKAPGQQNVIFGHGGYIYDTLMLIQEKGYLCTQRFDVDLMKRGLDAQLTAKLGAYKELYDLYQTWSNAKAKKDDATAETSGTALLKLIAYLESRNSILVDYKDQLEPALQEPTLERSVMKAIDIFCDEPKRVPIRFKREFHHIWDYPEGQKTVSYYRSEQKRVDREKMNYSMEIDKGLNSYRPVGITYLVQDVVSELHPGRDPKKGGAHASVISGRKIINGICHYQVRNSWGTSCEFGHQKEDGSWISPPIYRPEYICDAGTFWVPRADINRIVSEAIYQK